MRKPKEWSIDVFVAPADPRSRDKAQRDANLCFHAPRRMGVDEAMRFAKERVRKQSKLAIRSVSVAAPIESRRIIVYLKGVR